VRKDDFVRIKTFACMRYSLHLCKYMAQVYFGNDDKMPLGASIGCPAYKGREWFYPTRAVRFVLLVR
jgi:hypothetical protein